MESTLTFFFVSASQEPSLPLDDPMDVDTSYMVDPVPPPPGSFSSVPHSAAPTTTTFNQLFYLLNDCLSLCLDP